MMKNALTLFLLAALGFPLAARADQATSTSFILETGVIDVGGGHTTSSGFGLEGSVGQAGTGISTSTSFTLRGGFLNFPLLTQATSAPTSTPSVPSAPPTQGVPPAGGGSLPFVPPSRAREAIAPEIIQSCDFNEDARCNIIDLSILLYYYTKAGESIARYDLNRNEEVDFPDVSVLMFYWTG